MPKKTHFSLLRKIAKPGHMKWKLGLCNAHMIFNLLVYSSQLNEKLITFKNVLGLSRPIHSQNHHCHIINNNKIIQCLFRFETTSQFCKLLTFRDQMNAMQRQSKCDIQDSLPDAKRNKDSNIVENSSSKSGDWGNLPSTVILQIAKFD